PSVEVGFLDEPAGGVVGVVPRQAAWVGDGDEPQFGVVAVRRARAGGVELLDRQAERAVGAPGRPPGGVAVLDDPAFAVVAPGLPLTVGADPPRALPFGGPTQPGRAAGRGVHQPRPAERIPVAGPRGRGD